MIFCMFCLQIDYLICTYFVSHSCFFYTFLLCGTSSLCNG